MRDRLRLIGAVAGLVVLLLIIYMFVIGPKRSELAEVREQVRAKQSEVASLEGQLLRLQELQENSAELEAELAEIRELVPRKDEVANFIFSVQEAADESGVDFVQIGPELPKPPPEGAPLAEVRVSIGAGGGFFAVQDFLRRLYDLDRAVRIDVLSMSSASEGEEGETDTVLTVDLSARIFFELPVAPAAVPDGSTATPVPVTTPVPTPVQG